MNSLITNFDQMDRLFNQLWRPGFEQVRSTEASGDVAVLRPRVDVLESEKAYELEADLPGVKKDDLKIELERNVLTIEAVRKTERSEDMQGVHIERATNARYVRRFTLGREVDADKIEAHFTDGVLRLTVPKKEQALPRRISVK
jgi:HSP20 family protein